MPTPILRLLYSSTPSSLLPKYYTGSAGSYNDIAYTALPSSTGTRHRTHTVLIDQYSFGMRSIGCSSTRLLLKLLLVYGFVFVSSSLRLARQPPLGQSLSPVSFHAAVCCQARGSYIVPGATLLGAVLIWYTVNRLLQQTLLHKPLPFYGFVFVFLSYSSYSSSSTFLFCFSRGLPPRVHIKLPWGHLSMAGGLAEGN
mgnify:CR=1 FL=1